MSLKVTDSGPPIVQVTDVLVLLLASVNFWKKL